MPPHTPDYHYHSSHHERQENRPWNLSSEEEQLKQEERPARKGTNMDSHFQTRVNRRKDRYRSIIQGSSDPESEEDTQEQFQAMWDETASASDGNAAREARQRRLQQQQHTAVPKPTTMTKQEQRQAQTLDKVRHLRAQRLRTSFRPSLEEKDAKEILERRRQIQLEQDRIARERQELAMQLRREQQERQLALLKEERRQLEQERLQLQEAKRKAAAELQRRRKQYSSSPENSVQDEGEARKSPKSKYSPRAKERSVGDLSFLEEIQAALRDAGVIKLCVTSCFGEEYEGVKAERRSSKSSRSSSRRSRRNE